MTGLSLGDDFSSCSDEDGEYDYHKGLRGDADE